MLTQLTSIHVPRICEYACQICSLENVQTTYLTQSKSVYDYVNYVYQDIYFRRKDFLNKFLSSGVRNICIS